jgi:hypothetical protein
MTLYPAQFSNAELLYASTTHPDPASSTYTIFRPAISQASAIDAWNYSDLKKLFAFAPSFLFAERSVMCI